MQDNQKLISEVFALKNDYKMIIPDDFIQFICTYKKYDYAGTILLYDGGEAEFNNFLISDTDNIYDSMLKWYVLMREGREEYLTFAFGGGNDEFAIKTLGDCLGEIVHIFHRTEKKIQINFMFNNWKELKKQLEK